MKNFIFGILATILVAFSIAATPLKDNLLTTKPALPTSVAVYDGEHPKDFIIKYTNQGYIVQHISAWTEDRLYSYGAYVIMVKY